MLLTLSLHCHQPVTMSMILLLGICSPKAWLATVVTTSLQDSGISRKTQNLSVPDIEMKAQDLEPKVTIKWTCSILQVAISPFRPDLGSQGSFNPMKDYRRSKLCMSQLRPKLSRSYSNHSKRQFGQFCTSHGPPPLYGHTPPKSNDCRSWDGTLLDKINMLLQQLYRVLTTRKVTKKPRLKSVVKKN